MRLYGKIIPSFSEGIIDRKGAQTMLYLTCTTISSVDFPQYAVSLAKDWVFVKCDTISYKKYCKMTLVIFVGKQNDLLSRYRIEYMILKIQCTSVGPHLLFQLCLNCIAQRGITKMCVCGVVCYFVFQHMFPPPYFLLVI